MNVILLSGGSGKRLWPLSNSVRSKQFIKLFTNELGEPESMLERVYRQIKQVLPDAVITVATEKSQVSAVRNQLGDSVHICVEPCRKDTFPAIALATLYLTDVVGVGGEEPVVVCPVDSYVESTYFKALEALAQQVTEDTANLHLLGIEPTYPSEKYGYIIPETDDTVAAVKTFKEKPSVTVAEQYIKEGALWNGGIFAFRASYLKDCVDDLPRLSSYDELINAYDGLNAISFDYAVVEQEHSIDVMRYNGVWMDLGTWNTLAEALHNPINGNVRLDATCASTTVINELDIPIICMGLENAVVAAGPEGILVADKHQSSYMKPLVEELTDPIRFAEKSWGEYRVIDVQESGTTIRVTLKPGHRMNYHSHERRDEIWTVIGGTGRAIIDGMSQTISAGDVISIEAGCRHTVIADTELALIEVQLGADIAVTDKTVYPWPENGDA